MKDVAWKTIVFAAVLVSAIAINNVLFASELSTTYGYVGVEPQVELAAPFGPTRVSIYDQHGALLITDDLPAGAVVRYTAQDLGLSGLYYIRIVSDKPTACLMSEDHADGEWGSTPPQSRLYDVYSIGCPSPNSSSDDFLRIFAPRNTVIRVFDQHQQLLAKFRMERNEVREISTRYDWGLSSPYALVIRAEKPIAVSFLDGPGATILVIPQGHDSLP